MKEYLTIGEVSKMKGVGIKSLRYYDRLGILKPAYINPIPVTDIIQLSRCSCLT